MAVRARLGHPGDMAAAACAPTLPRRERKKLAVRERLLVEARRLFLARGVAGAGVAEIADAADVAPATFFNHFASKDALLAALTARALDPLLALLEPPRPGEPADAAARVAGFFERAPAALAPVRAELGDLLLALVRRAALPPPGLDPLEPLRRAWSRVLFDAQRAGALRLDVEAAFLADVVVGALHGALAQALCEPRYPLELRLAQLGRFVAGGLGLRAPASPPTATPEEENVS
jgi:AcrR family transcriptional regulator